MLPKNYERPPFQSLSAAFPTKKFDREEGLPRALRSSAVAQKSAEPRVATRLLARTALPAVALLKNTPERPRLDWAQAVRIATARLREKMVAPEGDLGPAIKGMAEELAVFLCAYGKLPEEFDRLEARTETSDEASGQRKPGPAAR